MALEIKYSFGNVQYDTEAMSFSEAWKKTYRDGIEENDIKVWKKDVILPGMSSSTQVSYPVLSEGKFYATDENGNEIIPFSAQEVSKIRYIYIDESVVESWQAYMLELNLDPEKWGHAAEAGCWHRIGSIDKWVSYSYEETLIRRWKLAKVNSVGVTTLIQDTQSDDE